MKERFIPRGVHIGRGNAQAIEAAHSQLPISARVYTDLVDQLRDKFDRDKYERAERVLWRVARQPKVLRSMGEFFNFRDEILKKELKLNNRF